MSPGTFGKATAVASVGVVASAVLATLAVDTRDTFTKARDWVSTHRHALPLTLAEFSSFPEAYRAEVFRQLSDQQRVALWVAEFDSLLARPDLQLTEAQRTHIERARYVFTQPSVYEPDSPANTLAKTLCEDAARLFTREQAATFFRLPGGEARLFGSLAGLGVRAELLASNALAPFSGTPVGAQPWLHCLCAVPSFCENCFEVPCTVWEGMCGCFSLWTCNGQAS